MPPLPTPRSADEVLADEAPGVRARLLEVAAALDRLDRAGAPTAREVVDLQQAAIRELLEPGDANRVERIQRLYSRAYDPDWRARFAALASENGDERSTR